MRLVAVLYCCLAAAAAKHVLFDHTINAGPLGLDLDGQLKVVGFGKRGAYHPLAVAGVKIGDVGVQVDGEAQPPGGRHPARSRVNRQARGWSRLTSLLDCSSRRNNRLPIPMQAQRPILPAVASRPKRVSVSGNRSTSPHPR